MEVAAVAAAFVRRALEACQPSMDSSLDIVPALSTVTTLEQVIPFPRENLHVMLLSVTHLAAANAVPASLALGDTPHPICLPSIVKEDDPVDAPLLIDTAEIVAPSMENTLVIVRT
jgi:hypothetical protein